MKVSALRRFATVVPHSAGVVIGALHPAYRTGRSIFSSRVFDPDEVQRVLKSGHQSRKIGKTVTKGHWRGFPIFTLTLEERATCPRSCEEWARCYGNNMQAAERIVAGPALEMALRDELAELQRKHPRGFAVRLHVLGDFYSTEYVDLWADALATCPALRVFGFTARDPISDPIGEAIAVLAQAHPHRFAMRFSGYSGRTRGAITIEHDEQTDHIVCPAQLEKTDCCATCALCWHSDRTIAFIRH